MTEKLEKGDYIYVPPGEIRIIKDSDYPEPINVTELVKRVEALEARTTPNEEMTVRISDTLEEIYNSLWKLRRDIHLIKEHKNAKLKN